MGSSITDSNIPQVQFVTFRLLRSVSRSKAKANRGPLGITKAALRGQRLSADATDSSGNRGHSVAAPYTDAEGPR